MPNATPFEKDEMRQCDALILQCGGSIVSFAQPRRTMQTEGIPDRLYRIFGASVWFEVKSQDKDAKLSAEQADFLRAELDAGSLAACGTVADLALFLPCVRKGGPLAVTAARSLVARWVKRGLRRGRKRATAGLG